MALYEHINIYGDVELTGQVGYPLSFCLPSPIGEQNEGDAVSLEVAKGASGTRQGRGAADEYTIDADNG